MGPFWLVPAAPAAEPSSSSRPGFAARPASALQPAFAWRKHDYAVRCTGERVRLRVRGGGGWRAKVNSGRLRGGAFTTRLPRDAGRQTLVTFRHEARERKRRFHLRCLPGDFPTYSFRRTRAGGPGLFSIQLPGRWAAVFNHDGVPVWWYRAGGEADNVVVLRDGTIAWDPVDDITFQTGDYHVRTLTGRLIRIVRGAGGHPADVHEILLLPNGNYLIGAQVVAFEVDTSAHGGSQSSRTLGIEIQELTPGGRLAWSWSSHDHIRPAETGRWWDEPILDAEPYDVVHWNSAEVRGRFMLLSFRHLDAVYKVDRRTGRIVWKLGGTQTRRSLDVRNDPYPYALGGQHDARFEPDGTVTVYDNRTGVGGRPRAVRYRIDQRAGTATVVDMVRDPTVRTSVCCGSARLGSGDWLVGWGGVGTIGGYDGRGRTLFRLEIPPFTYRANPVPPGAVGVRALRHAMNRINRRGGAGV